MRVWLCLLVIVCMGLAAPAFADYYKYIDKNGITRFTDNLADIPEDQRPKIKTFKATESEPGYRKSDQEIPRGSDEVRTEQQDSDLQNKKRKTTRGGSKTEQMRQMRDDLESEHSALMEEKEALEAKRDTLKTAAEVRAYQNEVAILNRKIAAFEKRREAFRKEVDAFNKGQGE